MKNNLKITVTAAMHLAFYLLAIAIIWTNYPAYGDSVSGLIAIMGITVSSLFNYIYFWKKLYTKPYHIYLRGAFSISIIAVSFSLLLFFVVEFVFFNLIFSLNPLLFSWSKILSRYLILGLCQLLMFAVQFLWIIHLARLGMFRKNTLIFGHYDERIPLENLFQDLYRTKNCVGQMVCDDGELGFRECLDDDFAEMNDELRDYLMKNKVNELILCMDSDTKSSILNELASYCIEKSIGYYLISDIRSLPLKYPWEHRLENIPVVDRYCPKRDSIIMVSFKRLFDIFASAAALIILSPVFLIISIGIALTDGFPIIYKSKRIGIHGKIIKFYKFRTMVKNAEALKAELLSRNERPDGPLFKMEDDPRVTKIGKVLRKLSLDELPQFWNVLRGDMSLIGPRPHLPEEVAEYDAYDHMRLECMPGISCLPQINGRDELGFRDWVNLDLEYRKNWSMGYDFEILWKTAGIVLAPIKNKLFKVTEAKVEE